jgi:hypothetical protein
MEGGKKKKKGGGFKDTLAGVYVPARILNILSTVTAAFQPSHF